MRPGSSRTLLRGVLDADAVSILINRPVHEVFAFISNERRSFHTASSVRELLKSLEKPKAILERRS